MRTIRSRRTPNVGTATSNSNRNNAITVAQESIARKVYIPRAARDRVRVERSGSGLILRTSNE